MRPVGAVVWTPRTVSHHQRPGELGADYWFPVAIEHPHRTHPPYDIIGVVRIAARPLSGLPRCYMTLAVPIAECTVVLPRNVPRNGPHCSLSITYCIFRSSRRQACCLPEWLHKCPFPRQCSDKRSHWCGPEASMASTFWRPPHEGSPIGRRALKATLITSDVRVRGCPSRARVRTRSCVIART